MSADGLNRTGVPSPPLDWVSDARGERASLFEMAVPGAVITADMDDFVDLEAWQ